MKEANKTAGRLKNVLMIDKIKSPSGLEDVLKSDVYGVLENYFDIIPPSIDVRLNIDENNLYDIRISLKAKNAKSIGIIIK
ncbi:MAG: hypothetical protein LBT30_05465 [Clostridiales bacterium]|jgi:septum formation topological specificity factor MinE|nr:hypothetical protein [Clostridiales bacterium]